MTTPPGKATKTTHSKKQKKAAELQKSVKERAAQAKQKLEKAAKEEGETYFPALEDATCVCTAVWQGGKYTFTTMYAFSDQHAGVYKKTNSRTSADAFPGEGALLCTFDDGSKFLSWREGEGEPEISGLHRVKEEKKTTPAPETGDSDEWDKEYGEDLNRARGFLNEKASGASMHSGAFKTATVEALAALIKLEGTTMPPKNVIAVGLAEPKTYGPDAIVTTSAAWYSTSGKTWMKPISGTGGTGTWRPMKESEIGIGATAAFCVFRSSGTITRCAFAEFSEKSLTAESASLDDLEKLVPNKEEPLTDKATLKRLVERCTADEIHSGYYIVGLQNKYEAFRYRNGTKPGRVTQFTPGTGLRTGERPLPAGRYVAYQYQAPTSSLWDEIHPFEATVGTDGDLQIGSSRGPAEDIWPKSNARRQALQDKDKPQRLSQGDRVNGQWRTDMMAFCEHYGLASPQKMIVFPMESLIAGRKWHISFERDLLKKFLEKYNPTARGTGDDPPPDIETLWEEVPRTHATVEWYEGAWDNPVNPRIYNSGEPQWSELAPVGVYAGKGRKTKSPVTGKDESTRVTQDIADRHYLFTRSIHPADVVKGISTSNLG